MDTSCSIFTYDAVELYPSIPTDLCISRIASWLEFDLKIHTSELKAIVSALEIILKNNRLVCGDLFAEQLNGIATGTSPATSIANLFLSIFEKEKIIEQFARYTPFLKRYIDDGFGVWRSDPDPIKDAEAWASFQDTLNTCGVSWTFSKRSSTAVFLDMNIWIEGKKILTSMFSKPLNLYLYIPPHSCHSQGIIQGLVHGHFIRIHILCSKEEDILKESRLFIERLQSRGYDTNELSPLLLSAEANAEEYACKFFSGKDSKSGPKANRNVYFHITFHPSHPNKEIKEAWRSIVAAPPDEEPLNNLKTEVGFRIPVDRFVMCYHKAHNLGNLLSYRKIDKRQGPKLSSYME